MIDVKAIALYVVRNSEGKYFRAKGYSGYGETWTTNFERARVYNRIGPARATVSWFANRYPEYPAPDLVQLQIAALVVVDETKRVAKVRAHKLKNVEEQKHRKRLWERDRAERDLEDAQRRLAKYRS